MFLIISDILSLLFIICGMLFLISFVFIKLVSFKDKEGFFVVLKADEKDDDLYGRVYSAFLEANMFNFFKVNKVVVLDYGVSESVKNECLSLFENSDILSFVNPYEAKEIFTEEREEIIY